jgi:hypothetical protein
MVNLNQSDTKKTANILMQIITSKNDDAKCWQKLSYNIFIVGLWALIEVTPVYQFYEAKTTILILF